MTPYTPRKKYMGPAPVPLSGYAFAFAAVIKNSHLYIEL